MTSSCTSSWSSNFFPARCFFMWRNKWKSLGYHKQQKFVCEFPLYVHLLRWEIVWRNAPRIWRDFGSALPFQTRLTQTKSVLPLSNEHGSQVQDQGRRQCCHNKHKKFQSAYTWRNITSRTRLVVAGSHVRSTVLWYTCYLHPPPLLPPQPRQCLKIKGSWSLNNSHYHFLI